MKIFVVGDFWSNNGPASVNKSLKKYLPNNSLFSEERSKFKRVNELMIKIIKSDSIIFSGISKINILSLRLCNILGKKSAYLMHGSVYYEGILNQNTNNKSIKVENKILKLSPIIICVSEEFMNWMKKKYPQYGDKLKFVNNGIEWNSHSDYNKSIVKDENMLLSIGGGMPQKNILSICKAIDYLNKFENYNLKITVIGKRSRDTEEIQSYNFVTYLETVKKEEIDKYYSKARIYIQNSSFETFGLASIEALICGCDLLISNNVGSKSILTNINEKDIINNNNDIYEISNKIKNLLENRNNQRLFNSINKEETSIKSSVDKIIRIMENKF